MSLHSCRRAPAGNVLPMRTEDERIAAWWEGLTAQERTVVRDHLDGELPESVVMGLLRAGVTVAGAVGRGGTSYKLPGTVAHVVRSRTD